MELLDVDVHKNTEVTIENLRSFGADEIVTASGSVPRKFGMKSEQPIYTADEVLLGQVNTEEEIVVHNVGDSRKVHDIMSASEKNELAHSANGECRS